MPAFFNPRINWREPVTETFGFTTAIFATASGREVREARRQWPKWSYRLPMLLKREEFRQLMDLMVARRREVLWVPAPTVYVTTASFTAASSDFIALPAAQRPSWLAVGSMLSILDGLYRVRAVSATGFNVDTLIVGGPGTDNVPLAASNGSLLTTQIGDVILAAEGRRAFPAGTRVALVIEARVGNVSEVDFRTTRAGETEIEVTAVHSQPVPYDLADYPAGAMHDGLPLLGLEANWRDDVSLSVDQEREVFSSETGPEAFYWQRNYVPRYWSHTWTGFTRAAVAQAIAFYVHKRGRLRTFYAAGPVSEIEVMNPVTATATNLVLRGVGYPFASEIALSPQFLRFETRAGTFTSRVTSAAESLDRTTLQMQSPFPYAVAVEDFRSVRTLRQSRFAEDNLEVRWYRSDAAEMDVKTRTLDYVASA